MLFNAHEKFREVESSLAI